MLGTESFDEIVLNISTKVLNCSSINTDKSRINMAIGHSGGLRKTEPVCTHGPRELCQS